MVALLAARLLASPASAQPAPEAPPPGPRVEGAPGKGLSVGSADGRFRMNLRGRFQLRQSVWLPAADPGEVLPPEEAMQMATKVQTARVFLTGHTLSEDVRYVFQLAVAPNDHRDGTISPIYDAYLDLGDADGLSVQVGQLFVPFDRARTIREFALQLPDRPRPVGELTLDRDVGVVLSAAHLGGPASPLTVKLSAFGGAGPNSTLTHDPGGLLVARAELRPLGPIDDDSEGDLERRARPGLALGLAAAHNWNTVRARSTTSTVYEAGTADYLHLAADAVFKWRGFALLAEGLVRQAADDQLRGEDELGEPLVEHTRSGWGAIVQPSLMLGPKLELALRWTRTQAMAGADPAFVDETRAWPDELGGGLSWYANGHRFKVQTGWTTRPGREGANADHAAHALVDLMF
jgi:hypothetical protein